MKKAFTIWILLTIHHKGLCSLFHSKKGSSHFKGWCPIAQKAYDLIKEIGSNKLPVN